MNSQIPNYSPQTPEPHSQSEGIDLKALLFRYLHGWYWFLLFIAIGLGIAWLYLRYTIPIYQVQSTLIIRDDGSKTGYSQNMVVAELGVTPTVDINSELQILSSSDLMKQVVDSLNLNVRYFRKGRVTDGELYSLSPIKLQRAYPESAMYNRTLSIRIKDDQSFFLERGDGDTTLVRFGVPFRYGPVSFTLKREGNVSNGQFYSIKIQRPDALAKNFSKKLRVEQVGDWSNTVALTMNDQVPARAMDVMHTLIELYDKSIIDEKNRTGTQTLDFINDRLNYVTRELSDVEGELESFKRQNEVPLDLSETAGRYINEMQESDNALMEIELRLTLLDNIEKSFLKDTTRTKPLPMVSEAISSTLGTMVQQYNDLVVERNRIMAVATPNNPITKGSLKQLEELETNILLSMETMREELEIRRETLRDRLDPIERKLNTIPSDQRQFLKIMREQQIEEQLFTFLLQKREEIALSLAAQVPNTRIVESPSVQGRVSPDPNRYYTLAFLLGLVIPIGFLTLQELLNNKIYSEQDIRKYTNIPFLGVIGKSGNQSPVVVSPNSRSLLAEMFRLLRTNLRFMGAGETQKVIMITSTVSGEGKTFITLNLGLSLATSGKKTLLLGFDLRKPKLGSYLKQAHSEVGLSNYLTSDIPADNLIQPTEHHENLFYLGCGPVPPNPAELLSGERLGVLFEEIEDDYDYILVDTSPVGLVADALLLSPYVDSTIFVVRFGYTKGENLQIVEDIYQKGKLPKPGILLSGVKSSGAFGHNSPYYGKNYGYYEEEKKSKPWSVFRLF